jgi:uncharacterized membrane protein
MNPTEHLGEEERLERIAALLSKGVTLMLTREAEEKRRQMNLRNATPPVSPCLPPDVGDSGNQAIVDYIFRVGAASPKQVQANLGLTRSSTWRRLSDLESRGVIVRAGRTRSVRYEIVQGQGEANEAKSASA